MLRTRSGLALLVGATLFGLGCAPEPAPTEADRAADSAVPESEFEATSLLGEELRRPELEASFDSQQQELLAEAHEALEADPDDVESSIWVGRRLAYLGRYREAIAHYGEALERFPDDPRLLRHRGHRYLTTRQLPLAVEDLKSAARLTRDQDDEVEPDGLPNPAGIPTSTLQTNIYYHHGLAHYALGEWQIATAAYMRCLELSENPDMEMATRYWYYLTLKRAGVEDLASQILGEVPSEVELLESHDYHALLLLFRGDRTVEEVLGGAETELSSATVQYGIAMHELFEGRADRSAELLRELVDAGNWTPFGALAAEADLWRASREN